MDKNIEIETPNYSAHNCAGSRDWLTCANSIPGSDSEQWERLLHTNHLVLALIPAWGRGIRKSAGSSQDVGAGRMRGAGRIWEAGRVQPGHGISSGWVLLLCSVFLQPTQESSPPLSCLCCDVGSEGELTSQSSHPLKRSWSHCYHSKSGQGRSWSRLKGQECVGWVWLRL